MSHDAQPQDQAPPPSILRRVLVLVAALLMMWGVRWLRVEETAGAADPLTLAACGFVLLAAFTVGELGASAGLPKVTGYILAGVLVGPQAANILSDRVVSELATFNTLALGLIATSAGLELNLPAIRKVLPTLVTTVGAKVALLPLVVGVPLFLAERTFGLLGVHETSEQAVLALIVSVLGIGTSPAIVLAVINDLQARGRLADLLLATAVVKDLVVVTCLAVAIAVSHTVLGGHHFDTHVLTHLVGELGYSVVAGLVVGGLFVAYFRWVGAEPLFSALVAILLVSEFSRLLHLEVLLVFIVAGFVVRNFSPYGHELLEPIERIALPVFVVFFTAAGAAVDLRSTVAILPLALALVALRAGAYGVAARFGAWAGTEDASVRDNAWLTYLPQAGVTLGLVLLAAEKIPELADPIRGLGVALVALNLLIGPITMSVGLKRAGEARGAEHAPPEQAGPVALKTAPLPAAPVTRARAAEPVSTTLEDPILQELSLRVERASAQRVEDFVRQELEPLAMALAVRAAEIQPRADERDGLQRVTKVLAQPAWEAGRVEQAAALLFDAVVAEIMEVPAEVIVPLGSASASANEDLGTRLRRWTNPAPLVQRLFGRTPTRRVPARLVLRIALEPRLADAVVDVAAGAWRAHAATLAFARQVSQGERQPDPDGASTIALGWAEGAGAHLNEALRLGVEQAVEQLAAAGGPALPERHLRFADLETRIGEAVQRLRSDGVAWRERAAAAEATLGAALLAETFVGRLRASLDRRARQPMATCRETLLPTLQAVATRLETVLERVAEGQSPEQQLAAVTAGCDEVLTVAHTNALRRASARFRRGTQPGPLVAELAEVVQKAPERVPVVWGVEGAQRPSDVAVVDVAFRSLVEAAMHDDVLPAVDAAMNPVAELVASAESRVREAITVARYGAELAATGGFASDEEREQVVRDAIRRGVRRVRQLDEQLVAAWEASGEQLAALTERATTRLRGLTLSDGETLARRRVRSQLRRLGDAGRRVVDAAVERGRVLQGVARALGDQAAVRDHRIRTGHERLDAAGIRQWLATCRPTEEARGIPMVYARVTAPSPVTERRQFVARAGLLDDLLNTLSARDATHPSTVLLGAEGAGRTSIVNMVKRQLVGPRVLWLDPAFSSRSDGPVRALATVLGCGPDEAAVIDALARESTVVLVDDLECWLEPSVRGVGELELLLQIIDRSMPRTRWLVSMDGCAFALMDELVPLRRVFRRVVRLEPLDWQALLAIFEQRAVLGGVDIDYRPRGLGARAASMVRPGRDRELYFRTLARASGGNPGTAALLHLQALEAEGESLRAGTPSSPELPVVAQLGDDVLAVLAAIARFGPMNASDLSALVARTEATVESRLGFLVHAGLLQPRDGASHGYALSARLVPSIRRELVDMGLLPGGGA